MIYLFLLVSAAALASYSFMIWLLPKLLSWIINKMFGVDIKVGEIRIIYLTLHDVIINNNSVSVHIDKIAIRSSMLNNQVTKMVCLLLRDVRINQDIAAANLASKPSKDASFTLPPIFITLAQLVSIRVKHMTTILLQPRFPEWMVHFAIDDVYLDGAMLGNAKVLLANVNLTSACAKLLRHSVASPTRLIEFSSTVNFEVAFSTLANFSIQHLILGLDLTEIIVNDNFYSFVKQLYDNAMAENDEKAATIASGKDRDATTLVKFHYFIPFLPKKMSVRVKKTTLKSMKDDIHSHVDAVLEKLDVRSNYYGVDTDTSDTLNDDNCGKPSTLYLNAKSISVLYDNVNFFNLGELITECDIDARKSVWSRDWLLGTFVNISVHFRNVVASIIPTPEVRIGCNSAKFLLNNVSTTPEKYVCATDSNWMFHLSINKVWIILDSDNCFPKVLNTCEEHYYGTAMYVGTLEGNYRNKVAKNTGELQMSLNIVRFEWSSKLARFVSFISGYLFDYYDVFISVRKRDATPTISSHWFSSFTTVIDLEDVTLFIIEEIGAGLLLRISDAFSKLGKKKWSLTLDDCEVTSLQNTNTCYHFANMNTPMVTYSKDRLHFCRINVLNLVWGNDVLQCKISRECSLFWKPSLHAKVFKFFSNVEAALNEIAVSTGNNMSNTKSESRTREFSLMILGKCEICVQASSLHTVSFLTEHFTCNKKDASLTVSSDMLDVQLDGTKILFARRLNIRSLRDNQAVRQERANADGFVLEWNTTYQASVISLKLIFPFEHEFAKVAYDDIFDIIKWLKIIHKVGQTDSDRLPFDIVLQIEEFLFELGDDPFEVDLRDNYELLVDEYEESIKRRKILEERLAKLSKERVNTLSARKIEELYRSLQTVESTIYIQRSKLMRKDKPKRTRLFAWLVRDFQIFCLADPSIHGTELVTNVIREVDPESLWPEEGIQFCTLWCRWMDASCAEWKFLLRDFPQAWLDMGALHLWGRLAGAEQQPNKRATREVFVNLEEPFGLYRLQRSVSCLKFYHDVNCQVSDLSYAFGPCWEAVISQFNLALAKLTSPSRDPSPPLPFWDKIRLKYHGRVTAHVDNLTLLLHASLDPYNTTEEMRITCKQFAVDWINARFAFKGNLEIFVRTASKYDDCRMLYLPNFKLTAKLTWICLNGVANDHHSVALCAPDKLPEYSSNREHDSYRAFRSQNLNVALNLETKRTAECECENQLPVLLLYASTLRWFESFKLILSGVTRPTRRGTLPLFKNAHSPLTKRRQQLSRHYRKIRLTLSLRNFQAHYWMSFSMQRGCELIGRRFTFTSEHNLNLIAATDGLTHRPRAIWSTMHMTCELNGAQVWLKSILQYTQNDQSLLYKFARSVEKCYFLSVEKVSYVRKAQLTGGNVCGRNARVSVIKEQSPTHGLVVHDLKGAWTIRNRDIVFALYDSFRKTHQLKKNLSTDALKSFRCADNGTPNGSRSRSFDHAISSSPLHKSEELPSPLSKSQSGHAANLLEKLIAEADHKPVVFSDDLSAQVKQQDLHGLAACQEDDVLHNNWSITLVNSQVLLKGSETKGYVIVSAAKAEITQKLRKPVWNNTMLVSKTSWVGTLECMQYYATVSENPTDLLDQNIMWLTLSNIQEKYATWERISDLPDLAHLVGSGQSVGGVVSETVGATSDHNSDNPIQLQRIVSRCKCEFFYVGFGQSSVDPESLDEAANALDERAFEYTPWERKDKAADTFTLMHHDLDVCTNSLQYAMILDIANNLILHVEPRRKEAYERLQRMRFQLQLASEQDQKTPIQQLQNTVRRLVANLRKLEKEMYIIQKTAIEDNESENGNDELWNEISRLECEIMERKDELTGASEELDMMLSCYKESALLAHQRVQVLRDDKPIRQVRASEICFKRAQWRLTETDGQLGIADLVLSNFLYSKMSKSDDSVEHLLELGYIRVTNLLANQVYREALFPTQIKSNMPVARKTAIRVFCRQKAPVGGITVNEHLEINVVPFTIALTKQFYDTMMKFCFPGRESATTSEGDATFNCDNSMQLKKAKSLSEKLNAGRKWKDTNFYVPIELKDDVEKMKERAEKNKLFIYIKLPEVPVRVSYKGNKETNFTDIRDFSLVIPTLEYHNVTWTWLDLLIAMKNDTRTVIFSQAIKQKFQIKARTVAREERSFPQEEDKAKLLFGSRATVSSVI